MKYTVCCVLAMLLFLGAGVAQGKEFTIQKNKDGSTSITQKKRKPPVSEKWRGANVELYITNW